MPTEFSQIVRAFVKLLVFTFTEAIMQGRVNGEFRIHQNPADPGSAAIFANYPAPYSSAGLGLVEEVPIETPLLLIYQTKSF